MFTELASHSFTLLKQRKTLKIGMALRIATESNKIIVFNTYVNSFKIFQNPQIQQTFPKRDGTPICDRPTGEQPACE